MDSMMVDQIDGQDSMMLDQVDGQYDAGLADMEFLRIFPPVTTVAGLYALLLRLCELIVLGEAAQDQG